MMTNDEIEIIKGLISFIKVENGKFSDTDIKFLKGINSIVNELSVENERWITIHPHGNVEDENGKKDYRRLLLEDGETPEEAIKRVYKKEDKKQEKTVEELKAEKKQLYQDVIKAKKEGNKELQRKLFDRYIEIERILKGDKAPKEEKKKNKEVQSKKLAGVTKGKPMSRAQADNNNPNPGYLEKPGCTTNCQTCVVAFEARLRGYDVKALGNHNNSTIKVLSHRTNTAWIDPKTGKHPDYKYDVSVKNARSCYKWLEKELQVGNRYTIEFGWKGRRHSGHIVSIEKDKNNNIIIYDPQNGHITAEKNNVLRYFQRFKYQISTYGIKIPNPPKVLRIDNMDFNYEVVDKILDKSN